MALDIGKSEHAFAVVDPDGRAIERDTVQTNQRSLGAFARRITKRYPGAAVAVEATSSYHEAVALAFLRLGITVRVVNPVLTATKAISDSVRRVKTDASDALGIARKLCEKHGELGYPFSWNEQERALQALGRSFAHLRRLRQSLRAHARSYADRPWSAACAPSETVLDGEIDRLATQLAEQAKTVFPEEMTILTAIRGLGEATAARLLAETMGVTRFTSGRAFAAFAGLDPRVKESGTSVRGRRSMTKSGSPILRDILGWAGKSLVRWNPAFSQRFRYDVERGKPAGVAYGIAARRLAVILHSCLSRKQAFDPARVGTGAVD